MPSWVPDVLGSVDPDEARRAAEEILARPEYREPQPSLVERVLEAIGDFLGRALGTLSGGGAGSAIGMAFVALLLALAGWLLAKALRSSWTGASAGRSHDVVQGTRAPEDPASWLAEADRLGAEGDLRGALRCRYQAMVATLLRDGVVSEAPGRTPAELRAELRADRPTLDRSLAAVTDRFERTWYGGHEVDRVVYDEFASLAGAVEATARQPVAVAT